MSNAGGSIAIDQRVDLVRLCETELPMLCIAEYLGHHSTVALSETCERLENVLVKDNDVWWKHFVLSTLDRKPASAGTEITSIPLLRWKELSDLVHCNLRCCEKLKSLGLDPNYEFRIPTRYQEDRTLRCNLNENENLCLLMGNNGSDDYRRWVHPPYRGVATASSIDASASCRGKEYPDLWSDEELKLLVKAGRENMGLVRDIATNVVRAIQEETKSVAPLAISGNMESLDHKLFLPGITESPINLPLTNGFIEQIIDHPRCRHPDTYDDDFPSHDVFEVDLGSDTHSTYPLLQEVLTGSSNQTGNLKTMWDAIEGRLLPEYLQGEISPTRSVVIKPFKMIFFDDKGWVFPHRDSKRGPGHFGTVVIDLPVDNEHESRELGGKLVLRCETEEGEWERQIHAHPTRNEPAKWHAFMHGTVYMIPPVAHGYRVSLVYQLWVENNKEQIESCFPHEPRLNMLMLLGRSIEYWIKSNKMELLVEFVLPLRYVYAYDTCHPLEAIKLRGSDWWLYRGLQESLKGTDLTLTLEYNGVCQNVKGWRLGVVTERGRKENMPLEERSKVIWLHPGTNNGFRLEDSTRNLLGNRSSDDSISVACISIHHKTFHSRYGRRFGYLCTPGEWTHYDDDNRDQERQFITPHWNFRGL